MTEGGGGERENEAEVQLLPPRGATEENLS